MFVCDVCFCLFQVSVEPGGDGGRLAVSVTQDLTAEFGHRFGFVTVVSCDMVLLCPHFTPQGSVRVKG